MGNERAISAVLQREDLPQGRPRAVLRVSLSRHDGLSDADSQRAFVAAQEGWSIYCHKTTAAACG